VASGLGRVEESKPDRQHNDQHPDGSQKETPSIFSVLCGSLRLNATNARRTDRNANDGRE